MGRQITGMQQAWRILHMKPAEVIAYQQEQLHDLIQFARKHSPFYQQLYAHLPTDIQEIQQLPPVTKPQLMANFDAWVTDRAITSKTVDAFLADKTLVGQLYLERYMLSTTSGSSGQRGIFIQNPKDELPYRLLNMLQTGMFSPRTLRRRIRWVTISATGDHFGSVSAFTLLKNSRQRSPFFKALFASMSILPVTMPFSELVQALNQERPTVIFGYSSIIAALAEEQLAGHLCVRPALVSLGGETISEQAHQRIATAFRCLVRDGYSTAECPFIAVSCPQGWLHVCSERALIEPVDEAYRPILPGQPSYTVLLTNLINCVQPIIRYDLGDSVTLRPDACPCGNPFPALKVLGRKNDILRLAAADGSIKAIQPMIFNALIDILPGVRRWQVIQNAPSTLSVRLEASSQAEDVPTWAIISQRLHAYCEQQNLSNVNIERSSDPPQRDLSTGKFYQVRLQTGLTQELSRNTSEHPWPVI